MKRHSKIVTGFENRSLGPAWNEPAPTWFEAIERYITFIQIAAWRARAPHADGREPKACVSAPEAAELRDAMLRVVETLASRRKTEPNRCRPKRSDLEELLGCTGRDVAKGERCSVRLFRQMQRALLLNEAGYTCEYCRRSAWGVLAEKARGEKPRTLRFEVDHRVTRRRLKDRHRFDAKNLVMACRSCNTIKAEMTEKRFRIELNSLARAVVSISERKG